jgi:subtilisin family serine protease
MVSEDDRPPGKAFVTGVAPGAQIVPFRVTYPGVVLPAPALLANDVDRLCAAITQARVARCHVISISLGSFSQDDHLDRVIGQAINSGIIVCAAGGNIPISKAVYPAACKDVIGVGALNYKQKKWRNSAYGDHVVVYAPGHGVYRAVINDKGIPVVERSSGTSYAVAYVAGIAALWLSTHGGHDALMARCKNDGRKLVKSFRDALLGGQTVNGMKMANAFETLKRGPNF